MTDTFWRDPPWRGGKGGYRMGLRPIDAASWLPEPIGPDERASKVRLLADPDKLVFAALDTSVDGQQCILDAVARFTHAATTDLTSNEPPLVRAALLVPDDLCLMQHHAGAYRLTAACVCAPSYWQLAEKIGKSLDGIHEPVQTLNSKLGSTMSNFFIRLPNSAIFERRNWLIHTDDSPFQPLPDAWPSQSHIDAESLFVRSERQTLRRLGEATIAFTIRVSHHPLRNIVRYPEATADLLRAFNSLDSAERAANGYNHYGHHVSEFLRTALAACSA